MPRPRTPFANWLTEHASLTVSGARSYVSHVRLLLKCLPANAPLTEATLAAALAARPNRYQPHARAAWGAFRRFTEATSGNVLPALPTLVHAPAGWVLHALPPEEVRATIRDLRARHISFRVLALLRWRDVCPVLDSPDALITVQSTRAFGWRVPSTLIDVLAAWGGSREPDAPFIPAAPGSPHPMPRPALRRAAAAGT